MTEYAAGGYIDGGPVPALIHPDECLITAKNVRAGNLVCSRPGHPTATSDCAERRLNRLIDRRHTAGG